MISRKDKQNFFAAHWDWLVAGAGAAVLAWAVAVVVMAFGGNADGGADAMFRPSVGKAGSREVKGVDTTAYDAVRMAIEKPAKVKDIAVGFGFLGTSTRRVWCERGEQDESGKPACGMPIPEGSKVCPFCGVMQPEEKKVIVDTNENGIPDDLEKDIGLDPMTDQLDLDKDGDGFSNREELAEFLAELAKPERERKQLSDLKKMAAAMSNPDVHPDYLKDLRIELPLIETFMPFFFQKAEKVPAGTRCYFFDPKRKNDYGKKGMTYSVMEGEKIGDTGFSVKAYAQEEVEIAIKGGGGMKKKVDRSYVTVVREKDRKEVKMLVGEKRKAIEVQAKLVYSRGGATQEFTVVEGTEIALNLGKYKVISIENIQKDGKGIAKVTLANVRGGEKTTISALEQ